MTNYKFNHCGGLCGQFAFTLTNLAGLRDKVRQIESSSSGSSTGAVEIEEHTAVRPADDETMVSAADYVGAGWYVCMFDGSANHFETEAEALVDFIEDRYEVRLA